LYNKTNVKKEKKMEEQRYWDQDQEEELYDEGPLYATYIRVNGMNHDIEPGVGFKDTVQAMAKDGGLGKFRVFVDGNETGKTDSPEVFTEGMKVELRPYDVAG
jgi:hypothetical protein